jgi:FkbM family methyltransferase
MTQFLLKDIIRSDVGEITIVDVGAMLEGTPRYDLLMSNYKTHVTGFEPDKDQYKKLCDLKHSSVHYLPYFLADKGESTFCIARYPGCSSLYEPDVSLIDLFTSIGASIGGNFEIIKKEKVETVRLDDVYDFPNAHYIKIDVQGAELDVLRGAIRTLQKTLVLEIEVEFVPLYKNQPLFGDIQCFLREKGFLFHKFIDISGRCFRPFQFPNNPFIPVSQMLWADAIFVRDFTKLENFTDQEILILAVVMHDLYLSYDFTYLLLSKYDDRRKTDLKTAYLQKLQCTPNLPLMYLTQKQHP